MIRLQWDRPHGLCSLLLSFIQRTRTQRVGDGWSVLWLVLHVVDSKQLKEEEREALFGHIEQHSDWIGWGVHVCSPKDISESMLRK
jgi:hypothetical protein